MSQELPPPIALFRLATGYYVSCAIYAAAKLGIADLMNDGPQSHDGLAAATATHAPSLRRVLRLLASAGVLAEEADGRFSLTPIGACLRKDVPGSMHAAALLFGGRTQRIWNDLLYSIESGAPAAQRVSGMDTFTYFAEHPEEADLFDAAMANVTRQIAPAVIAAYDFERFATVIDVGGGNGVLLEAILKVHPSLRGVAFDLPHVAERARRRVAASEVAERCSVVGGDFFHEVPRGGDAYLLKHVIHDWDDRRASAILRNCRRAMEPGARLLIIEGVYPPRIDQSEASRGAAANDVNMLVVSGGRQRSAEEFRALFEGSGLTLLRTVPTSARVAIIEGAPGT